MERGFVIASVIVSANSVNSEDSKNQKQNGEDVDSEHFEDDKWPFVDIWNGR